jgi:hypothetical protein
VIEELSYIVCKNDTRAIRGKARNEDDNPTPIIVHMFFVYVVVCAISSSVVLTFNKLWAHK